MHKVAMYWTCHVKPVYTHTSRRESCSAHCILHAVLTLSVRMLNQLDKEQQNLESSCFSCQYLHFSDFAVHVWWLQLRTGMTEPVHS